MDIYGQVVCEYNLVFEESIDEEFFRRVIQLFAEKKIKNNISECDQYRILMGFLKLIVFTLAENKIEFSGNEKKDILKSFQDIEKLNTINSFLQLELQEQLMCCYNDYWIPKEFIEFERLSDEVFELAQEVYLGWPTDEEIAENLEKKEDYLRRIRQLESKIKHAHCQYADEKVIIDRFNEEYSELLLDLDTMCGETFMLSFRMRDAIEDKLLTVTEDILNDIEF